MKDAERFGLPLAVADLRSGCPDYTPPVTVLTKQSVIYVDRNGACSFSSTTETSTVKEPT